jgi:MFS family permease
VVNSPETICLSRQGLIRSLRDSEGVVSTRTSVTPKAPSLIALAVPLLGIMGAIQGSAPNINSTALITLSRDLNMTGGGVALAASIQTLFVAATVITTGLLADRLGRRRVLLAALIVGAVGSAISGLAPVSGVYFIGQALTGVGLGAVYGASFAYIRAVAKPGQLPAALGVFGATIGVGSVAFMFLGSFLVGVDWRLGFFVTTATALIAFVLVPIVLPPEPPLNNVQLDVLGQLLLGLGIVGLLYGVSQLGRSLTSPQTMLPLGMGAVLFTLFFVHEAKSKQAFYPVRIFKSPLFIAAILVGFVYNFGTAVSFLQLTNLWQYVTGVSTSDIAFWQVPLTAAGVVSALLTGRLMSKGVSNRTVMLIGTLITSAGFVMLAVVSSQKTFMAFLPGTITTGAGVFMIAIPFGNLIMKVAPPAQFGPVTSSRTTIGQFFYSIGFAVSTIVVDRLTIGGVVRRLEDAGVPADSIGTAVSSVNAFARSGTEPSTKLGKEALADAVASYSGAFTSVMLLSAVLMLVAGLVAVALIRKTGEPTHDVSSPTPPDSLSPPSSSSHRNESTS